MDHIPHAPSVPIPVRSTPAPRRPHNSAADRIVTSALGRCSVSDGSAAMDTTTSLPRFVKVR